MNSSYDRSRLFSRNLAVLPVLIAVWLALGLDGRLHWDEPHYLYTGAFFSIEELITGYFKPSGIEGFTVSRIAHVALVRLFAELFGIGGHLILIIMLLYTALLGVFLRVTCLILCDLEVPAADPASQL
jgi:hypothetical protein